MLCVIWNVEKYALFSYIVTTMYIATCIAGFWEVTGQVCHYSQTYYGS